MAGDPEAALEIGDADLVSEALGDVGCAKGGDECHERRTPS
jgi:hypothetical protein